MRDSSSLQRDEVDRIVALAERDHAVEDAAVRVAKEVARVDELGGVVERVVVDQDRAEDGFLGVETVRERAFGGDVWHRSNRRKNTRSTSQAIDRARSVDHPNLRMAEPMR